MSRVPDKSWSSSTRPISSTSINPPDTLRFCAKAKNVIVLRTFSKIHGLASLRIGYGIARPELIQVLQKTRQPFNINGLAQTGGARRADDEEHLRETKRLTDEGRAYLEEEFAAMNLQFVPSAANFVLVKVGDGAAVFQTLLATADHRPRFERLQSAGMGPHLGRHDGAKPQMHRRVEGSI